VAGLTAAVRNNRAHRTREVAVARALAAAGAPVVAPFAPAGPHEHDGRLITLWALAPGGLAAYGAPLPELFVRARGLQVVAWSGLAAAAGAARARLPARLAWLRGQLG
jgi:hypothetical protein